MNISSVMPNRTNGAGARMMPCSEITSPLAGETESSPISPAKTSFSFAMPSLARSGRASDRCLRKVCLMPRTTCSGYYARCSTWRRDWGLLRGENPAARIRLLPETRRDRFLSPDELARVNFALDQEPNQYWRAYFVLSLLLGTRKTELLSARWSDVDLMRQTLRISRTKNWKTASAAAPQSRSFYSRVTAEP